jgi:curved DNA-binding protein CbpA
MPNYYLTLDIMPGSSQNEILHAYNRAKMTYSSGSLASYSLLEETNNESIVHEIEKAFEILGNPSKRREYDLAMGFSTWSEDDARQGFSNPVISQAPAKVAASKMDNLHDSDFADPIGSPPIEFREKVAELRHGKVTERTSQSTDSTSSKNFEPNPDFETRIKALTDLDGAFLRAVRVYRNLTVEQLASISKIAAVRITAIEEEDTTEHNQSVYLRGHVAILCRALDLPNPENLSKGYIQRLKSQGKLPADRI